METNEKVNAVETVSETKEFKRNKKSREDIIPPFARKFPKHILDIALLIHNNAEIKRFTALGIINYLLNKKEIKGNHRFVIFKWNKFAVKCDGLTREYLYTEPFFLNSLVASFSSFSASAQRTIDEFVRKEMSVGIDKAVDGNEVNEIVAMVENDSNRDNTTIEE
jgi:hypothetical protein